MNEKNLHALFDAGMIIKAVDSFIEATLGIVLLIANPQTINQMIFSLFGDELTEQPRDAVLNFFIHGFNGLAADGQLLWACILLAHGLAKIFLVIGLYKDKLWIYPVSAIVFGLFAGYQIWHIILFPSTFLVILTTFDILFIALIAHEYRYQKKLPMKKKILDIRY